MKAQKCGSILRHAVDSLLNRIYGLERQETTTRRIVYGYSLSNMASPLDIITVTKPTREEMGWTCRMHGE